MSNPTATCVGTQILVWEIRVKGAFCESMHGRACHDTPSCLSSAPRGLDYDDLFSLSLSPLSPSLSTSPSLSPPLSLSPSLPPFPGGGALDWQEEVSGSSMESQKAPR